MLDTEMRSGGIVYSAIARGGRFRPSTRKADQVKDRTYNFGIEPGDRVQVLSAVGKPGTSDPAVIDEWMEVVCSSYPVFFVASSSSVVSVQEVCCHRKHPTNMHRQVTRIQSNLKGALSVLELLRSTGAARQAVSLWKGKVCQAEVMLKERGLC